MTFGRPPDKDIDWTIWSPLIPVKVQKYLSIAILAIGTLITVALIFILRQGSFASSIHTLLYNKIIYNFFPEAARMTAIVLAVFISLGYIITVIFLHEFLHIVCYPKCGRTHTYIFFDKRTGALVPMFGGEMSRERRLLVNAMPLIVLSLGIYFISFFVGNDLRNMLRITCLVNLALSYVDVIGLFFLLRLPPRAIIYLGIWRK